MSAMIRFASSASRAQWTCPPACVTDSSSRSRYSSRWRNVRSLRARPASRSSCQSGSSSAAAARFSRIERVALPMLCLSWASAREVFADSSKDGVLPGAKASGAPFVTDSYLLGRSQDLRQVDGLYPGPLAREAAADVHQARVVPGGADLR